MDNLTVAVMVGIDLITVGIFLPVNKSVLMVIDGLTVEAVEHLRLSLEESQLVVVNALCTPSVDTPCPRLCTVILKEPFQPVAPHLTGHEPALVVEEHLIALGTALLHHIAVLVITVGGQKHFLILTHVGMGSIDGKDTTALFIGFYPEYSLCAVGNGGKMSFPVIGKTDTEAVVIAYTSQQPYLIIFLGGEMVEQVFLYIPNGIVAVLIDPRLNAFTFDDRGAVLGRQGECHGTTVIHTECEYVGIHHNTHVIGVVPAVTKRSGIITLAVPRALPRDGKRTGQIEVFLIGEEVSCGNIHGVSRNGTDGLMQRVFQGIALNLVVDHPMQFIRYPFHLLLVIPGKTPHDETLGGFHRVDGDGNGVGQNRLEPRYGHNHARGKEQCEIIGFFFDRMWGNKTDVPAVHVQVGASAGERITVGKYIQTAHIGVPTVHGRRDEVADMGNTSCSGARNGSRNEISYLDSGTEHTDSHCCQGMDNLTRLCYVRLTRSAFAFFGHRGWWRYHRSNGDGKEVLGIDENADIRCGNRTARRHHDMSIDTHHRVKLLADGKASHTFESQRTQSGNGKR